jgi:radical SAM superfamily enzyme YgiQ (UPF0313 family)
MTILVLNPPSSDGLRYLKEGRCESRAGAQLTVPITLGVVAAVARRAGHPVFVRDYQVSATVTAALDAAARASRLALLVTTTPTFAADARFAAWLRARHPGLALIAWGTLPTALPERSLAEAPALDAVILGEPEGAAEDLCALLRRAPGALTPALLAEVAGLVVRGVDGRPVRTPPRVPPEDLDALPWAARDLLENERYTEPSRGLPFTVIQVSRGCPYPCTYCTVADYHGKAQRWRSPGSIVAEVRHCVERYGIRSFLFLSDLFTFDHDRVLALCEALRAADLGVRWFCNSRADTIDAALARAMGAAGCYLVSFGVESAAPAIQRVIRKPMRPERFFAAAEACRAAGIRSYFYWVLGFPGETPATIRETVDTACRVDSDFAAFYFAVPYPGTPLYAWARENGRLRHEDWARYDMADCDALRLDDLTPAALTREVRRASLGFYLRPSYLRSIPRRFTRDELRSLGRRGLSYLPTLVLPRAVLERLGGVLQ